VRLETGQTWQFFNGTTEETRQYELEHFEDEAEVAGARARLRNLDNDKYAEVTCRWLREKHPRCTGSHWRLEE